jgi:hypothetical protein
MDDEENQADMGLDPDGTPHDHGTVQDEEGETDGEG